METPRRSRGLVRLRLARTLAAILLASMALATGPLVDSGRDAAAGRRGTLLVIGDSLTVGATSMGGFSPRLRALASWTSVVVDARVGRSARAGATTLAKRLGDTAGVTAIVVALGTNDMAGYRDMAYARRVIDAVLTQSRGLPVLWVNLEFGSTPRPDRRSRGVRFNAQLDQATLRWKNLLVADWNSQFTPRGASRFVADGMHLTASGYRDRSRFMIAEIARLTTWIDTGGTTTTTATTTTSTTTSTTVPATTTTSSTTTSSSTMSSTTTSSTTSSSTTIGASSTSIP